MKLTRFSLALLFLIALSTPVLRSQTDHYEGIFNSDENFRYLSVRTAFVDQQNALWRTTEFNDSSWAEGPGGIGFGDDDDGTLIPRGYSVYLRKWFTINDIRAISQLILLADYDDGFVAYLNGQEIARANIPVSESFPAYNRLALGNHDAIIKTGGYPEPFIVDSALLSSLLVNGENLLAVQVHNESSGSRDLSANLFLAAGIKITERQYQALPDWFDRMREHFGSTIPLVVINTFGKEIPDEPKIPGTMKIINRGAGPGNSIFDQANEYDGLIAIEQRGYSSRYMYVDDGKISYSLETQDSLGENNNVKILGMPSENDWVLYGPYSDKTLLKNVMAYWIGNNLDQWAPRTQYVDVILNGKQMGLFAFMEKVKRDKDRVNIAAMDADDLAGDSLSGGYLVKVDRNTGNPLESWDSPFLPSNAINQVVSWVLVYPRPEEVAVEQFNYIREFITSFERLMSSSFYKDPFIGYRNLIDLESFIDFFLVGELFRDADAFRSSMYLHKDRDSEGGLLKMGPLWDFNYSMGNYDVCGCASSSGWAYLFNYYCNERYKINPFWWEKLVEDDYFNEKAGNRWIELRKNVLSEESLMSFIDSTTRYFETSQKRNFEIWPILGTTLWPNFYVGGSYENEIAWLKIWIQERLAWLDDNIPRIGTTGTGPETILLESQTALYPNPLNETSLFKLTNYGPGNLSIEVFSSQGAKITAITQNLGYQGTWMIPFPIKAQQPKLPKGIYHYQIKLNQELKESNSFLIN